MIKLSLADIAAHFPWQITNQEAEFQGISTDSRKINQGNLFVAIQGENFDGHDFIDEAVKKEAGAVLVNHACPSPIPQIIVNDTLAAFGQLSEYWRARFSLPIAAVTGSNGKTTLKNMLASIMSAACGQSNQVLATEGNLNNNIGVPIMLSRLNSQHRYAVIEMGMNHFGEIEYLTKLTKPQVAVINNAAAAHLEGVNDIAGVAKAKGEIFLGLQLNGTAILNRDDGHYDYWLGLVKNYQALTFGFDPAADVTGQQINNKLFIKTPKGALDIKLPLLGKHNAMNALAATAAALALHIELEAIKKGLESVQPAPGRLRLYTLPNGAQIIDDTYNANPFSTQAAINTLASFTGQRILVLGDMKELGDKTQQLHFSTGEEARRAGIDQLFTLGEMTRATAEAFGQHAYHFTNHHELIHALLPHVKAGVTILVKGSRSMHMEKIVAGLIPAEQLEPLH